MLSPYFTGFCRTPWSGDFPTICGTSPLAGALLHELQRRPRERFGGLETGLAGENIIF